MSEDRGGAGGKEEPDGAVRAEVQGAAEDPKVHGGCRVTNDQDEARRTRELYVGSEVTKPGRKHQKFW